MKFLVLFLLSFSSFAATIKLEPADQKKLALLIGEMPLSVRTRNIENVSTPVKGIKVTNHYETSGMQIDCTAWYYLGALYFSDANCKVTVDLANSGVAQKNSEVRVTITDPEQVKAISQTIPYGNPKDYRGWERDQGVDFDGYRSPIFHFLITCTNTQCLAKFSSYNLVQ